MKKQQQEIRSVATQQQAQFSVAIDTASHQVIAEGTVKGSIIAVMESKSGGKGHIVSVRTSQDRSHQYLDCSCPGGQFAWATRDRSKAGRGCWAMQAVRKQIGWGETIKHPGVEIQTQQ